MVSINQTVQVQNDKVSYTASNIESNYTYTSTKVTKHDGGYMCQQKTNDLQFKLQRESGKVGVMMIGLGGNNGTTLTAAILANRQKLRWNADRKGEKQANWYGSVLESSTMRLGNDEDGSDVWVPLKSVVPIANASDIVLAGWDIHDSTMADSMDRAKVLAYDLQQQLTPQLQYKPCKGIFRKGWIAGNQDERANWVKTGSARTVTDAVKQDISDFKAREQLDKVIVFWSGNTERFSAHEGGVHDTAQNFLAAVERDHQELAPSALYCLAAIESGCTFINGSPQNTFCAGLVELAQQQGTFLAGDDLKTGQTKMKSVLADFLVASGLKLQSIASYNHLGNNDGLNLNESAQFRSKEVSKSDVVNDIIESNSILYKPGEKPDHVVVIKYMPYVGDSKRALDEYTSELILGGDNTIVMHNTCEDSLLAAPLMMDLILLAEFCDRVTIKAPAESDFKPMYPILSLLSLFLKAPIGMPNTSIINAFFSQRSSIVNFFRILVGLTPEDHLRLEDRFAL